MIAARRARGRCIPRMVAGNAAGFAASRRYAPPSLRCGPSGDTAKPAAWGLLMTGKGLPVIADRLDDASSACLASSCQLGSRRIRHLDFLSAPRVRADWSTMASGAF